MSDARLLVVDDEPDILSILVYQLSKEGFRVSTAVNGQSAIATAAEERPDLVILDLMLPGIDGYEVLKRLRQNEATASIPVILLTARREEEERLRGFEFGADDYVTKPFSPQELVFRVRALLRRTYAEPVTQSRRLKVGSVELERDAHRAFSDGVEIDLTPLEYRLLEVFLERRGRVQTRRQLLQAAWQTNAQIETRTVDMHVARLRSKLGDAGELLETVRGVGYRFRVPESEG
ncbi:MAG: response regulator transcription factor [marine benthic group bacterium]|nr:response regulator transcription factor [Gemmatimonadota bacterium]MCL7962353.1 response regulator transcription factor [Candidatus Carthagonibacter metallireducens]MCL7957738.1 response regulator transcription factor [Gemmatimonadota bacterium]MCL7964303.1 response regulator transcription factor [Gemmatimonadota bacterium]MCL7966299.1 response regulator transcription factor [Gemmatimonadota bacterium]